MADNQSNYFPSHVLGVLAARNFTVANEKALQAEVFGCLSDCGFKVYREFRLSRRSIIDHAVENPWTGGLVGIECKLRAGRRAVAQQCRRYLEDSRIEWLILISQTSITEALPRTWILRPTGAGGLA